MSGVDLKGRSVIKGGVASHGEALVRNGRLLIVIITPSEGPREGYGSAQLKDGVASHGEARIVAGRLRVVT